jgi:hypothetical protein
VLTAWVAALPASSSGQETISAALVGVESTLPDEKAGDKLRELLSAELSGAGSRVQLVERARVDAIIKEQALRLSGATDAAFGKVAGLLDAKLLIIGRAYPLGDEVWVSAKLFHVPAGSSEVVLVKRPARATLAELASELAKGIAKKLDAAPKAEPAQDDSPAAKLARINAKLGQRARPAVEIVIASATPLEPALQRALRLEAEWVLKRCGFRIVVVLDEKSPAVLKLTLSANANTASRVGSQVSCEATVRLSAVSANGKELRSATGKGRGLGLNESDAAREAVCDGLYAGALELLPELTEVPRSNK